MGSRAAPFAAPLLAALLLAALLLSACADGGGEIVSSPVQAAFAPGSGDHIAVTVADPQPVEAAELVAPDGSVTPADQIERSRTVERGGGREPSIGVGVFGGSSGRIGTSVGINVPLGGIGAPDDPVIDSRALIEVPDMDDYRARWTEYRVRLHLGTNAANRRVMEIPAPRPPEG